MLIDLKELFSKDNNELQYKSDIDFDSVETRFGSFKIKQKSPLKLTLFHKHDRQFSVEGNAKLVVDIPCDRCLTDVAVDFDISISKEFDLEKETSAKEDGESEETRFVTDAQELDAKELIKEELFILWPSKVLCKEDCKGLCKVCGHNLNVSDCGCDRVVLDPRMAAIQDIFKNAGN